MSFRAHARNTAGESAMFYAPTQDRLHQIATGAGMEIETIEIREFENQVRWAKVAA